MLRGGRKRRRGRRALAVLALLLVPLAAAAGAYLVFEEGVGSNTDDRMGLAPAGEAGGSVGGSAGPVSGGDTPRNRAGDDEPVLGPDPEQEPPNPSPLVDVEPTPEVPLAGSDAFGIRLRKPPRAALAFDVDTGKVLWRRRPLMPLPIASLTKVMTALIVTERTRPREPVRITQAALDYSGSGVGVLPRGRRVRLETLLNGMLIVSGNDAAIALAVHVAGSERRFVRMMNRRARRWGLRCTRFSDSHGLSSGNISCPRDLAVLTRLAMTRRRIARIARRQQVSFHFPIKGRRLYLNGHNPLIRAGYAGAIGLKTGYTNPAGRCFIGVARRNGRTLAVVLLNSPNPQTQSAKLLDRAFASL